MIIEQSIQMQFPFKLFRKWLLHIGNGKLAVTLSTLGPDTEVPWTYDWHIYNLL